ncbi:MAG: response regulator transcription factor [Actinobacteria bacterium]|nr:MAG: response regulator transcription factor [Actinomycetota bacterium]
MAIRVLLADDHRLILEALERTFDEVEGIEIVGTANDGRQVVPLITRTNPDLVLLDMRMPEMDGLTCLERIRKQHPRVKVVMLSAFDDPERVRAALKRGASAYIVKTVNPLDLPAALRQVVQPTIYFGLPPQEDDPAAAAGLTERETAMLRALARGLSNAAISREFWVTEQTVKFHLTNIYRKLGVKNRTEATRYAYQHGLADELAVA